MEISEQRLNRNIVSLALPAAGESLLQMTVFITDGVFMSWVGSRQLAAVDISALIAGILMMIVMAIGTAATSLVARHTGAGKQKEAEIVAGQSLMAGFFASMVLAAPVMVFAPPLLRVMGLKPDVVPYGVTYLRVVLWAAGPRQVISTGCGILRGAGDTRTPMFITLIMNVVNVILGMCLVFGLWIFPRLEVLGAGLALCAANLVGAALVIVVLFSRRRLALVPAKTRIQVHLRDIFSINRPAVALLFRIGIPAGVEMFAMRAGYLLYVRIITSLGTAAVAANAIALRIESLSFMPGMGIAMAAMTLVGQSLGAGQPHLAEKSMKRCMWLAVAVMSLLGLVCLVAARPLAVLFTPDRALIGPITVCIRIAAVEQPLLGFVMVYMGGLRGAGDTMSAMVVSLVGSTFVRVPLVWLLARTWGLGLAGAWLGAVIDWNIRAVIVYWLVRRGRWKRLRMDLSTAEMPGPTSS